MNTALGYAITSIGIPTRNRPESLRRCLDSFRRNLNANNREAIIWVVDNASDAATGEAARRVEIRYGTAVNYVDRPHRARMASALAARLQIPETITRFALLGDDRCPDSYGACRNTLLLLTAGQMTIQADDDTIWRFAEAPNRQNGILFTPNQDANTYRYYATEEEAMSTVSFAELDVLALHEGLLGKPLTEFAPAGKDLDLSQVDAGFVARMQLSDASVASTYVGTVGDSGMYGYAFRLFEPGEALERMMASEEAFREGMTTRWILKAAQRTSISSGSFCMTIHTGLDNRRLLPPFMPVMRNEDGVWGAVRTVCFPGYFSGYLPYVAPHLPPETRAPRSLESILSSSRARTNDLICQLIWHLQDIASRSLSLCDLGSELVRVSRLPEVSFQQTVDGLAGSTRDRIVRHIERILDEHPNAGMHWKDAMLAYRKSLHSADRHSVVAADLERVVEEPRRLFQDLVAQYGTLLTHWPSMVDAARQTGLP